MSFLFLFGGICDRSLKGRLAHPALNQPKLSSCEPQDLMESKTELGVCEQTLVQHFVVGIYSTSIVNKRSLGPIVQGFQEPKFIQQFFGTVSPHFLFLVDNFTTSQLAWLGKSSVKTVPHTDHRPVKLGRVLFM